MRKKRLVALATVAALLAASITGCSSSKSSEETTAANGSSGETQTAAPAEPASYPLDTDETLTYWGELNVNIASNYTSMEDTPLGQAWQEATGVDIEFQHPAIGQVSEQFNLLMSKQTLPDMIEYSWITYPGGPTKAIDDGVIIPLNDIIDQYCPNLKAYLEANPEIDRMVKTDDGTYYCFPFIRGDESLLCNTGPMIRQDWLDDLGLEVPTTVDEWYEALKAFKEEKGATAPFTYQYSSKGLTDYNPFAGAFGAIRDFFLDEDGKVIYGAVQEGYKNYLMEMNKWMEEGLIDPDLATLTSDQVSAKITNGSAGASFGWAGSNMGTWIASGQSTDPNYNLVPTPYPTLKEGETPKFGRRENNYPGAGSVVITTSCENVELAARFLDYGYSEEGHMMFNFGIEGESYNMVDGKPVYTDMILHNEDGLSITATLGGYTRANTSGPFVQDKEYITQYYSYPAQAATLDLWSATDAKNYVLPPITPTVDESKEPAQIMNEIATYRDEMTLKFILGTESFDNWDTYVSTIESMGLDRALEIENAALDRYNAR